MGSHKTRRNKQDAPALEWLCDLSGQAARITSIGNRSLLVENHCGISEFTSGKIVLSTRCGPVVVSGMNLSLTDVRRDSLVIRGSVQDVQLPCREAKADEP